MQDIDKMCADENASNQSSANGTSHSSQIPMHGKPKIAQEGYTGSAPGGCHLPCKPIGLVDRACFFFPFVFTGTLDELHVDRRVGLRSPRVRPRDFVPHSSYNSTSTQNE